MTTAFLRVPAAVGVSYGMNYRWTFAADDAACRNQVTYVGHFHAGCNLLVFRYRPGAVMQGDPVLAVAF